MGGGGRGTGTSNTGGVEVHVAAWDPNGPRFEHHFSAPGLNVDLRVFASSRSEVVHVSGGVLHRGTEAILTVGEVIIAVYLGQGEFCSRLHRSRFL